MPPKDIDANMTPQETAPSSPTDVQPPRNEVTTAKSSLEDLQTEEQRNVLDTVARVRKCGLESEISLPQLVVCGAQSAGKSSVLEALTEIPFPRNEQLCTRFPTEIHLRRGPTTALTDLKEKKLPSKLSSIRPRTWQNCRASWMPQWMSWVSLRAVPDSQKTH
jgi:hypothetical protein